jgi:hypothetical protein
MPTVTAQQIVDRAEKLIQDETNVRWPEAELLGWLNDGQREIVLAKPDAYTKNQALQLAAGTKQALPTDGLMLLDVVRNMGTDGTTAGAAIRVVSREVMDAQNPNWHTDTASATVKHYVFDPRDPKRFYVWPKSAGTNYVEIMYAAIPADVLIGATITLDDIFMGALIDYILYRAYSKDTEYAGNVNRAGTHYQAFANALGLKSAAQMASNPNLTHVPFNPLVPGAAK